jgi:hypothetical protein
MSISRMTFEMSGEFLLILEHLGTRDYPASCQNPHHGFCHGRVYVTLVRRTVSSAQTLGFSASDGAFRATVSGREFSISASKRQRLGSKS